MAACIWWSCVTKESLVSILNWIVLWKLITIHFIIVIPATLACSNYSYIGNHLESSNLYVMLCSTFRLALVLLKEIGEPKRNRASSLKIGKISCESCQNHHNFTYSCRWTNHVSLKFCTHDYLGYLHISLLHVLYQHTQKRNPLAFNPDTMYYKVTG